MFMGIISILHFAKLPLILFLWHGRHLLVKWQKNSETSGTHKFDVDAMPWSRTIPHEKFINPLMERSTTNPKEGAQRDAGHFGGCRQTKELPRGCPLGFPLWSEGPSYLLQKEWTTVAHSVFDNPVKPNLRLHWHVVKCLPDACLGRRKRV
jgi:hypothetical protein